MSPPAPPGTPPGQATSNASHAVQPNQQQQEHAQEVLLNPDLLNPSSSSSPSPLLSSTAAGSTLSSRASSIHGGRGGSATSTISESGESVSSLGGLNHVNDGVGGSTVQRRMSRAYSNLDDDFLQQAQQQQRQRRVSTDPIAIDTAAAVAVSPALQRRASLLPSATVVDEDEMLQMEGKQESCFKTWLRKKVPVFGWLISPGYNLNDLPDDLIAGITISTVVIPQSMAYAMLAPLPPVYGLYTSVVPILIYCLFGTSRHMHTGTFAITTLLLGQAVRGLMAKEATADILGANDFSLASTLLYDSPTPTPIEDPEYEQRFIGMILMLSFVVGCLQVMLSFLRVGGWASKHLLPDALVGGFNTAAVFHIGTSQLKHFLGFKSMPSPQGAFALIKSWIWIGKNFWEETNWYTVGLGTIAILMMLAMRKAERKRKAAFELKLRKEEMFLVQQRQAISAAIVKSHEEQREQQRQWQQQQQQKGGDAGVGPSSSGSNLAAAGGPLSPYQEAPSNHAAAGSTISLRTVADEDEEARRGGPSITFAPAAGASRTLGQVEQALQDPTVPVAAAKDRPVYIPIPDILLAVIILTVVNVLFSLDTPRSKGGMGIAVIGSIPKGLPQMAFPANLVSSGPKEWLSLEFFQRVILPMIQPALLISVIIFVMSFSIAKQFGKRYGYKVDANQEMMALGLASMGGSIFSGYACTGSLTRTAILAQSGGKTPLASIVGVITVTLTLVCLTWCFERVPNAVLAAIVLVALQSLVMQIVEPLKLWRLGQRKASIIWTVTFLGVLIVSVELGIAIGIAFVLLATSFGWAVARYRGEGNDPDRDALLQRQRRRLSAAGRRESQGVDPSLDASARRTGGGPEDATESLLNHSSTVNGGLASAGAGAAQQQQWRRPHGSGVHLSAPSSPAADWKRKMMRTKWGQRIGSFFGMEQPIFTDSLHANTDDDDY
ncbi:MAG: sulfate transporter family-domain-containing protein [Linnemannia gamsii]|nr:MAG: sulfate transporter family-domain-containing protein [Linnemannia gamsii]